MKRAKSPFQFVTRVDLVELTGISARNLEELTAHLKDVPEAVIYYHTHHFLRQHHFLSPEPPNDFAYWVTQVLQEDKVGEQLASVDTVQFSSIAALRARFVEILEKYLQKTKSIAQAPPAEEFYFRKAVSFILPTPHQAFDLAEFIDALKKVTYHSLYHHIFDARLRLGRATNDFSKWLSEELEEPALAKAITRLDPYTQTLEALRHRIIWLAEERLRGFAKESVHAS